MLVLRPIQDERLAPDNRNGNLNRTRRSPNRLQVHFYFLLRTRSGLQSDEIRLDSIDLEATDLETCLTIPDLRAGSGEAKASPAAVWVRRGVCPRSRRSVFC